VHRDAAVGAHRHLVDAARVAAPEIVPDRAADVVDQHRLGAGRPIETHEGVAASADDEVGKIGGRISSRNELARRRDLDRIRRLHHIAAR
jgi:hypothetical protein